MTPLPKTYEWLNSVNDKPAMVTAFISIFGTQEVPGTKSNPEILQWAKKVGVSKDYTNDGIAWCGLTIAYLCFLTSKPSIPEPLYALNWRYWGLPVTKGDERLGDVYVRERKDSKGKLIGGHVGLYIAEDETHWHIGGGNQSDTTCIERFAKTTPCWFRRPVYVNKPLGAKKYLVSNAGIISNKMT